MSVYDDTFNIAELRVVLKDHTINEWNNEEMSLPTARLSYLLLTKKKFSKELFLSGLLTNT